MKSKTYKNKGKDCKLLEYSFERERCRNCPRRPECIGKSKRIAKMVSASKGLHPLVLCFSTVGC